MISTLFKDCLFSIAVDMKALGIEGPIESMMQSDEPGEFVFDANTLPAGKIVKTEQVSIAVTQNHIPAGNFPSY